MFNLALEFNDFELIRFLQKRFGDACGYPLRDSRLRKGLSVPSPLAHLIRENNAPALNLLLENKPKIFPLLDTGPASQVALTTAIHASETTMGILGKSGILACLDWKHGTGGETSPLQYLISRRPLAVIKAFFAYCPDDLDLLALDCGGGNTQTALHAAVANGFREVAFYLMHKFQSMPEIYQARDTQYKQGFFLAAIRKQRKDVVEYVDAHRGTYGDLWRQADDGQSTALDIALMHGNEEVISRTLVNFPEIKPFDEAPDGNCLARKICSRDSVMLVRKMCSMHNLRHSDLLRPYPARRPGCILRQVLTQFKRGYEMVARALFRECPLNPVRALSSHTDLNLLLKWGLTELNETRKFCPWHFPFHQDDRTELLFHGLFSQKIFDLAMMPLIRYCAGNLVEFPNLEFKPSAEFSRAVRQMDGNPELIGQILWACRAWTGVFDVLDKWALRAMGVLPIQPLKCEEEEAQYPNPDKVYLDYIYDCFIRPTMAAHLWVLVNLFNESLIEVKTPETNHVLTELLDIMNALPVELQHLLCNRICEIPDDLIPANRIKGAYAFYTDIFTIPKDLETHYNNL